MIPFSFPKFRALFSKPDFIIVNTKFSPKYGPNTAGGRFFQKLYTGKGAYRVVFRQQTSLSWLPLKQREVMQQINTINPEIVIYKKLRRP